MIKKPADRALPKRPGWSPLPWLILALSLGLTGAAWHNARQDALLALNTEFQLWVSKVVYRIAYHLKSNVQILRGVAGLFDASETTTRQEFRRYVAALRLEENYPGIQGIGFAAFIPADQKAAHEAAVRQEGFPDYTIHPAGARAFYTAVLYLEPFTGRNLRAFGYDMAPEPVRWAAAARARDEGQATLSGKITLQQEAATDIQPGFFLFVPVYLPNTPTDTVEQRRAALRGWVYSPLRMRDLMQRVLRTTELDELRAIMNVEIYDGDHPTPDARLFALDRETPAVDTANPLFQVNQHLEFGGHSWLIRVTSTPEFEARRNEKAILIALSGSVSSLLLALLMGSITSSQRRIAAALEEKTQLLTAREQAEQTIARRENLLRKIIEILPVGLWIADPEGNLLIANPMGLKIWGAQPRVGPANYGVFKARRLPSGAEIQADDWALVYTLREGVTVMDELLEIETFDGQKRIILNYTAPVFDDQGALQAAIVVNHDITERHRAEAALRFTQAVMDRMSDEVFWALPDGHLVYVNVAACQTLGYTPDELLALSIMDIVPDYTEASWVAHWRELRQAGSLTFEGWHQKKNGAVFPVEIRVDYLQFEGMEYACGLARDITERQQMQEALRDQAIRDPLTGLFNRRYLDETLPRELSRCQRSGEPLALAMMDLDHFKNFNDDYGHEAGDVALRTIGGLLRQSLRTGDIACRYGGEELTLILPGATLDDARARLEDLRFAVMRLPMSYRNGDLPAITVSVGLTVARPDEVDAAAVLGRADAALYQAKQQGRNRVVCHLVPMLQRGNPASVGVGRAQDMPDVHDPIP